MKKEIFLSMLLVSSLAWAEGDETTEYAPPPPDAEVQGSMDADASPAGGPGEAEQPPMEAHALSHTEKPDLTAPPPASQSDQQLLREQIRELTAELRSVKQELHHMKKPEPAIAPSNAGAITGQQNGPVTPAGAMPITQPSQTAAVVNMSVPPSGSLGVAALPPSQGKDEIADILPATDENDGARTLEERAATQRARDMAGPGTLSDSSPHGQYNQLCGLYNETMLTEGDAFKAKATQFKAVCARFIAQHKDHSFSRSAIFYLGAVLLKNNEFNEAQQAFAAAYKGDEKGPHAADALLGIAEINAKNGKKDFAVTFLSKVKKDFDPHYLTEDTKEKFKHVAKLAGSPLVLGKGAKPAVVETKADKAALKETKSKDKAAVGEQGKKRVASPSKQGQSVQA